MRRALRPLALAAAVALAASPVVMAQSEGEPVALPAADVQPYAIQNGDLSYNIIGERLCGPGLRAATGSAILAANPGAGTLTVGEILWVPKHCPIQTTTTTSSTSSTTSSTSSTTSTTAPTTTTSVPPTGGSFAESFATPHSVTSRNGPLDPALYSVSRWRSEQAPNGQPDTQGNGPALPGDIRYEGGRLVVETGMQNYGDTLVRINRPMVGDTLQFDVGVNDWRDGDAMVYLTDTPMTTPGFDGENAHGSKPRNGFQFRASCFKGRTYVDYVQTEDPETGCNHRAPNSAPGGVIRYTLTIGANSVTVTGDGHTDSWPVSLDGPQWLHFGSHNHATIKYSQRPTFTSTWDNIEYEADAAASVAQVPNAGPQYFGYPITTQVTTSAAQAGPARLVFNLGLDRFNDAAADDWGLAVTVNGETTTVPFPLEQHNARDGFGNQFVTGNYIFDVPVTAAAGANTISFATQNVVANPIAFANVDLISEEEPSTPPTSTTTAPTVTSTTVAPTTTVVASSTSTPSTTSSTTTAPPATTTTTPAGLQFSEDFSTADGFYNRFDFGLSQHNSHNGEDIATNPGSMTDWEGDHSMACSGPDQLRPIHVAPGFGHVTPAQVATATQKSQLFWWCAPGGDAAKGHLMTSTNGFGYLIAYFSPKQTFTDVAEVCWDQNTTDMDSKWINVVLAPIGDVELTTAWRGFEDLGFDPPGFQPSVARPGIPAAPPHAQGPTTNVWTPNGVGLRVENGLMNYWEGADYHSFESFPWYRNDDKATRYRHCMRDNGDGTITLTQNRPAQCNVAGAGLTACGPRSRTVAGSFPDGEVRVVFHDDMYDPPKRGGYNPSELTWHWDNITIR